MKRFATIAIALLPLLLEASPAADAQEPANIPQPTQTWKFQVLLDDKPIGLHSFAKYGEGDDYEMGIAANFQVKILFITAYHYEHSNQELWRAGCLHRIESQTDDNGDLFSVKGRLDGDAFKLVTNQKATQLPACISTFAYWDQRFLNQSALLNSQTGEYIPVTVSGPFTDTWVDRGQAVKAWRHQIKAKDVDLQLWYSESGDWLGLESALENDRTLRYERI